MGFQHLGHYPKIQHSCSRDFDIGGGFQHSGLFPKFQHSGARDFDLGVNTQVITLWCFNNMVFLTGSSEEHSHPIHHKNAHAYPSGHESTSIYCRSLQHAVQVLVKVEAHPGTPRRPSSRSRLELLIFVKANGLDGILAPSGVHTDPRRLRPYASSFHSSHRSSSLLAMFWFILMRDTATYMYASAVFSSHVISPGSGSSNRQNLGEISARSHVLPFGFGKALRRRQVGQEDHIFSMGRSERV